MANRKISWRERRWKLFKRVYDSTPMLRAELECLYKTNDPPTVMERLDELLESYGVTSLCTPAVLMFLQNPEVKDKELMKGIIPPFFYWDAASQKFGPPHPLNASNQIDSAAEYFEAMLRINNGIPLDTANTDFEMLSRKIGSTTTVLQISPFVNKSELHELIDEYWSELEPLINHKDFFASIAHGNELRGKIQPQKTPTHIKRNELIAKLYKKGYSDHSILIELPDEIKGKLTANNIKQIRYKLGLTKKRKS